MAAVASIGSNIDKMSKRSAVAINQEPLKSIKEQLDTLTRPHLHKVNKVISLSMHRKHGQSSGEFHIFDGYLMKLITVIGIHHDRIQISLILVKSDHDNSLKWPFEKHAQLYMSTGENTPFSLSQVGTLTKKVDRVIQLGGHNCTWRNSFTMSELPEIFYVKLYSEKPPTVNPRGAQFHPEATCIGQAQFNFGAAGSSDQVFTFSGSGQKLT